MIKSELIAQLAVLLIAQRLVGGDGGVRGGLRYTRTRIKPYWLRSTGE